MSETNVAQPALSQGFCDGSGMGHLLGYARVSTTDQHPQLQVDALELAGCYRVFTETAGGARTDRPALEQLLDQLRPAASSCSTCSRPWPSSNATSSANAPPLGWPRPGPAAVREVGRQC